MWINRKDYEEYKKKNEERLKYIVSVSMRVEKKERIYEPFWGCYLDESDERYIDRLIKRDKESQRLMLLAKEVEEGNKLRKGKK